MQLGVIDRVHKFVRVLEVNDQVEKELAIVLVEHHPQELFRQHQRIPVI